MKKALLLILLMSLFTVGYGQKFYGGVFGGLSGCGIGGNQYRGLNKLGFTAGVYTYLQFNQYNGIQMEIAYSLKGDHHNPSENEYYPQTYNLNLNFIEIPLLYKLSLGRFFDVKVGLSYNALLGHKETINGINVEDGISQEIELSDYHTSSMNFVASLSFNILPRLFVDVRTSIGLTSFRGHTANFPDFVQRFGWGQFTDTFTVSVGYRLFGKTDAIAKGNSSRAVQKSSKATDNNDTEKKSNKIKIRIGGNAVN